jgi:hypothetical protein
MIRIAARLTGWLAEKIGRIVDVRGDWLGENFPACADQHASADDAPAPHGAALEPETTGGATGEYKAFTGARRATPEIPAFAGMTKKGGRAR